jgi:hypothetical protein
VPETALPAADLDLISFLWAIPDTRMRRGIRIPAWTLLLVAVLGILSRCQSLPGLLFHWREPRAGGAYTKLLGDLDLEGVVIQADALHTQRPFFNSSRSRVPTSC